MLKSSHSAGSSMFCAIQAAQPAASRGSQPFSPTAPSRAATAPSELGRHGTPSQLPRGTQRPPQVSKEPAGISASQTSGSGAPPPHEPPTCAARLRQYSA